MWAGGRSGTGSFRTKALEQAVSFLGGAGIQVDERIVPRSAELPPMGMERDLEEEQTLAAALLGDA